jgi:hypothetical protein
MAIFLHLFIKQLNLSANTQKQCSIDTTHVQYSIVNAVHIPQHINTTYLTFLLGSTLRLNDKVRVQYMYAILIILGVCEVIGRRLISKNHDIDTKPVLPFLPLSFYSTHGPVNEKNQCSLLKGQSHEIFHSCQ